MIWEELGGVGFLFKRMILHGVKCLLGLTEYSMQENKDKYRSAISGRKKLYRDKVNCQEIHNY